MRRRRDTAAGDVFKQAKSLVFFVLFVVYPPGW